MIVAFLDAYKLEFGVKPICISLRDHNLPIAPSTYYAYRGGETVKDGQGRRRETTSLARVQRPVMRTLDDLVSALLDDDVGPADPSPQRLIARRAVRS